MHFVVIRLVSRAVINLWMHLPCTPPSWRNAGHMPYSWMRHWDGDALGKSCWLGMFFDVTASFASPVEMGVTMKSRASRAVTCDPFVPVTLSRSSG